MFRIILLNKILEGKLIFWNKKGQVFHSYIEIQKIVHQTIVLYFPLNWFVIVILGKLMSKK